MLDKPLTNKEYMAHAGNNCPYCGKKGTATSCGQMESDDRIAWQNIICKPEFDGCGSEWTDEYRLVGWTPVE